MSEFRFSCPACGRDILADTSYAGKNIACPVCQTTIVVPKEKAGNVQLRAAGPPPFPGRNAPVVQQTSHLAVASLVCSLLSLILCVGWLPGIICGHLAKGRLRRNPSLKGLGMAKAGLVIGYLVLVFEVSSAAYYTWRISTAVKQGYENARQNLATNNFIVVRTQSPGVSNQTQPEVPAPGEVSVTNGQPLEPFKTPAVVPPSPPTESGNPVWTSDVGGVSFPAHPVSGKLHGLNFALTTTGFRNGDLRLRSADNLRLDVYHLGTSFAGRSYLIQPDDNRKDNPHVKITWHEAGAIRTATYNNGYGLKLEFARAADRKVAGKIYLRLPDDAKSYVAGTFEVRLPRRERVRQRQ